MKKEPRLELTITAQGVYLFKVKKVTGHEEYHLGSLDPYSFTAMCSCEDCTFRMRACKHIRRAALAVSILMDKKIKWRKLELKEDEEKWLNL